MSPPWTLLPLLTLSLTSCLPYTAAQSWWPPDSLDIILAQMELVTESNCGDLTTTDLRLSPDTLPQLPRYSAAAGPRSANRSLLWDAHSLALAKGIAYSVAMSRLNESWHFAYNPGLLAYYVSTVADLTSHAGDVVGSGVFFDTNTTYSNWYATLPFNRTLELFGPRGYLDDPLTSPTDAYVTDYGAGPGSNYTSPDYLHNPWYALYLPDVDPALDPVRKWSYVLDLRGADSSEFLPHVLFYSALPKEDPADYQPVTFTVPYFDCGRTNSWVVSAVAPVVDYLPRYLDWYHLRRHVFVAETVVDVEFSRVDMNQCPAGPGNELPNRFAGTARCKPTTECSPLAGFGLSRGGYECTCLPGLVYPPGQSGPYQGVDIETATQAEYEDGFDCVSPAEYREMGPKERRVTAPTPPLHRPERKRHWVPRYKRQTSTEKPHFDPKARLAVDRFMLNKDTLKAIIPEEVTYGANEQFTSQAKLAVRLANFLSNYIENLQPTGRRDDPRDDRPLHRDAIIAEVVGNVMADPSLIGSGVFFDEDKYLDPINGTRQYYGPYAYRPQPNLPCGRQPRSWSNDLRVRDRAGDDFGYADESWFTEAKDKWNSSAGLQNWQERFVIRSDVEGTGLKNFGRYPMYFKAATLEDGVWSAPYCPCDGEVQSNVLTYSSPIVASDFFDANFTFRGVVTVDVPADLLDLNQCFQPFAEPNFFKNTAMCDYETTTCRAIRGHGFRLGGYECVCKEGHVYPAGQTGPFTSEQVETAYLRGETMGCIPLA